MMQATHVASISNRPRSAVIGVSITASDTEGGVLIEETWNPEFEACRALVARGVKGRLEVWRPCARA